MYVAYFSIGHSGMNPFERQATYIVAVCGYM